MRTDRRTLVMGVLGVGLGRALAGAEVPASKGGKMGPVRFAFVSDTHSSAGEKGERYAKHLEQVTAEVNDARVDAVLFGGDLTNGARTEEIVLFRAQVARFNAPAYLVPGNHDIGNKRTPGKNDGVSAGSVARYEAAQGPSFYASVIAGVRLVALNAGLFGSGLPREEDQWSFLERELGTRSEGPALVLLHNPPFTKTPDEPGDYWNLDPEPRARLLGLLRKGGVRAVLSGHLHRPLKNSHEGILYLTTPPVSFGLPEGKQPEGWTLITLSPDGQVQDEFRAVAGA